MKLRSAFYRRAFHLLCILLFGAVSNHALAQDELSLKHGTYVLEGTGCKEPPFAAMMSWDGAGFSGPHDSRCTSSVLSHHGSEYRVRTTCAAQGDGSPNPSGRPEVETFSLTRLSSTRFSIAEGKQPQSTYRWCSPDGTNDGTN
jgi:hypothetical protein